MSTFGRIKQSITEQAHSFLAREDSDVIDEQENRKLTRSMMSKYHDSSDGSGHRIQARSDGSSVQYRVDDDKRSILSGQSAKKKRRLKRLGRKAVGTVSERLRDHWDSMNDVRGKGYEQF